MKFRQLTLNKLFIATTLSLTALSANAVLLNPGDSFIPLPGTTAALNPQLAGSIIVDELVPFSFSAGIGLGNITGTVQQRIVRSSVDGTLDFYWRVFNDGTSAGAIGDFRLANFVSPEYEADWRIDGLGDKAPDTATRFSGANDSYVNFSFNIFSTDPNDGLLPGTSSNFMFLDTTAKFFTKTAAYDLTNMQENPISMQFEAYSPAVVPVPAAVWLFGSGLAGLVGVARRRKTT